MNNIIKEGTMFLNMNLNDILFCVKDGFSLLYNMFYYLFIKQIFDFNLCTKCKGSKLMIICNCLYLCDIPLLNLLVADS